MINKKRTTKRAKKRTEKWGLLARIFHYADPDQDLKLHRGVFSMWDMRVLPTFPSMIQIRSGGISLLRGVPHWKMLRNIYSITRKMELAVRLPLLIRLILSFSNVKKIKKRRPASTSPSKNQESRGPNQLVQWRIAFKTLNCIYCWCFCCR